MTTMMTMNITDLLSMTTVSDLNLTNATTDASGLSATNITSDTNLKLLFQQEGEEDNDDGAIYFEILLFLATYLYPVLTLGGVFLNALSVVVLQSASMRHISMSVYLTVLAATDSLVLLLDFINNYLKEVVGVYALAVSDFLCTLYRFSFDVVFTMSAWLIVAITVERFLVVWFPLKLKTLVSVSKARLVSLIIFLTICVYKLYNFWAWEVRDGACDWKTNWENFHMTLNMPLTFTAYSYVPLVILVVCNGLIVWKLWKQQRHRQDMTLNSNNSDTRRLTITVLVISSAYLVLTVPLSAYYTLQYADQQFIDMTPQMAMGEMIILMVGLSNHAINFFLYIISSRSFRKVFLAMCRAEKFCSIGGKGNNKPSTDDYSRRGNAAASSSGSQGQGGVSSSQKTGDTYASGGGNSCSGGDSGINSESNGSHSVSEGDVEIAVTKHN